MQQKQNKAIDINMKAMKNILSEFNFKNVYCQYVTYIFNI